jgi:hypothetical protein
MDRKVIVYGLTCGSTDTSLVLVYGQENHSLRTLYGHMPWGLSADNFKCHCLRTCVFQVFKSAHIIWAIAAAACAAWLIIIQKIRRVDVAPPATTASHYCRSCLISSFRGAKALHWIVTLSVCCRQRLQGFETRNLKHLRYDQKFEDFRIFQFKAPILSITLNAS